MTFKEKFKILDERFDKNDGGYHDSFNDLIEMKAEADEFKFLNVLNSKEEVLQWVRRLQGRLIMHEDDALLEDIIDDYILCG